MPEKDQDLSQRFVNFVAKQEGTVKRGGVHIPYDSPEGGNPTVGIGHKVTDEEMKRGAVKVGNEWVPLEHGLTDEQAEQLFRKDAKRSVNVARRFIGKKHWDKLPQNVKEATIDMAYTLGPAGLAEYKNYKKAVLEGDYEKAAEESARGYFKGERKPENFVQLDKRNRALVENFFAPEISGEQGQASWKPSDPMRDSRMIQERPRGFLESFLLPQPRPENAPQLEGKGMVDPIGRLMYEMFVPQNATDVALSVIPLGKVMKHAPDLAPPVKSFVQSLVRKVNKDNPNASVMDLAQALEDRLTRAIKLDDGKVLKAKGRELHMDVGRRNNLNVDYAEGYTSPPVKDIKGKEVGQAGYIDEDTGKFIGYEEVATMEDWFWAELMPYLQGR